MALWLAAAALLAGVIAYLGLLSSMVAIGLVGVALAMVVQPRLGLYLWVFSLLFYAYRVDVAGLSWDLYRFAFILVVAALPVTWTLTWRNARTESIYPNGFDRYTVLVGLGLGGMFVLHWVSTPGSAAAQGTTQLFTRLFALGVLFVLLGYIGSRSELTGVIGAYIAMATAAGLGGWYEAVGWLVSGSRPSFPFSEYAVEEIAEKTSVVAGLETPRVESFFHDANFLAITLTVAVIAAVALARDTQGRWRRRFLYASAAINLPVVFFTVSRSGMAAALGGLTLFWIRTSDRPSRILASLAIVVAVAFGMLFIPIGGIFDVYREAVLSRLGAGPGSERVVLGRIGMQAFSEAPLVGHGAAGFVADFGVRSTHSFYISLLAEYGLVGFGLFGLIFVRAARGAWKSFRKPETNLDVALAVITLVLLTFQVVYDSLFLELIWLPFAIVYCWSTLRLQANNGVRGATAG